MNKISIWKTVLTCGASSVRKRLHVPHTTAEQAHRAAISDQAHRDSGYARCTGTSNPRYFAPVLEIAFAFLLLASSACNSDYTIRQKGYFRIDFPKHEYRVFNEPGYPYRFEYPVYARVVKDTTYFEDKPENPYWINIEIPSLDGKIYMSYKEVRKNDFNKLVDDAFKLTYKHSAKATAIRDSLIRTPNNVSGIFFKVGGNAATGRQFFLTDSVNHFLRGALYFDATPNADSLGIVNDFLEADMKHLINSLTWSNH